MEKSLPDGPARRSMSSVAQSQIRERRADRRYPVTAAVKYKVVLPNQQVLTGVGETVNLSSGGVLLQTTERLPGGLPIELSIPWPARSGNRVALVLHMIGRTVRMQGICTAVKIQQHEFRIRGAADAS
jgi:hypothetical protein